MDIYDKISVFPYFLLFLVYLVLKHDFIRCVDFTTSQLQTQNVMTSQIRSQDKKKT